MIFKLLQHFNKEDFGTIELENTPNIYDELFLNGRRYLVKSTENDIIFVSDTTPSGGCGG